MSPAEARRTALAEFGGLEQVKEHVRDGATGAWLHGVWQDVRYAARTLFAARAFTAWTVGSLAIGMAVASAMFALLNASLFRPFPGIIGQDRLVRVTITRNCGTPNCWSRMSSDTDYAALSESISGLQSLTAYTQGTFAVTLPAARSMQGILASPSYFDVLGVRPALGRLFGQSDARENAAVAVLPWNVWTQEFGADPAVIGRAIRVGDEPVEIIGVTPAFFIGTDRKLLGRNPDIWLPMWLADRVLPSAVAEQRRRDRLVDFVGRLKDGVAVRQVQAEVRPLAVRLAASRGDSSPSVRTEVRGVGVIDPSRRSITLMVVLPIPILVLAIACVNAANLMLARGSQRQRELAIRLAIGARRARIVRQLLIESGALAALATIVAVPLAWWTLHRTDTPLGLPIPFDASVLALIVLTAVATTLAFGLAPALRGSRQQPVSTLGLSRGRNDATPGQSRTRSALLIAQVALSLALLATAWQFVSTVRSQGVSSGTPADHLLIARFDLQLLGVPPGEAAEFYSGLVTRGSRLTGVESAGLARHTSVWSFGQGTAPASVTVWRPHDGPEEGRVTIGGYATGDLFSAVGLRLITGRDFVDADRLARPQVAVVNQTFAAGMNGPAVGSILRVAPRGQRLDSAVDIRIVGVVEAAQEPSVSGDDPPPAKVYLPASLESEPALSLYLRTRLEATTLTQPVRDLVAELAPRVPILDMASLEQFNERSFAPQLFGARAATFLGVVGLLLATAGLYGVSSYVVAMRAREMAIRIALGARPQSILAMTLGRSLRVAMAGLVIGGGIAVAVSRMIRAQYHGVQQLDVMAFGGAAGLFVCAMVLASAIPAVRASRVDPVENLKD